MTEELYHKLIVEKISAKKMRYKTSVSLSLLDSKSNAGSGHGSSMHSKQPTPKRVSPEPKSYAALTMSMEKKRAFMWSVNEQNSSDKSQGP